MTTTFRQRDGGTLHVRKATAAEPGLIAIQRALGVNPEPGGTGNRSPDTASGIPVPMIAATAGERPEFYDFDLFGWSASSHELDDRPLSELAYTVFDTETTGLHPSEGDEIIQIGATRIVNRRLLRYECFDQLVKPQVRLSPGSIEVHGLTRELLAGQPSIDAGLPRFHAFCATPFALGRQFFRGGRLLGRACDRGRRATERWRGRGRRAVGSADSLRLVSVSVLHR